MYSFYGPSEVSGVATSLFKFVSSFGRRETSLFKFLYNFHHFGSDVPSCGSAVNGDHQEWTGMQRGAAAGVTFYAHADRHRGGHICVPKSGAALRVRGICMENFTIFVVFSYF